MARGDSGRIVLEIDPADKQELYAALAREGLTLKNWFLRQAARYLSERHEPSLFGRVAEEPPKYGAAPTLTVQDGRIIRATPFHPKP
jgi:hypothetical protein